MTTGAVILAGGESRRLGRPKQLVRFHGNTLVRLSVSAARHSHCDAVCVVTGAYADAVEREVLGLGATVVHNAGWREGMAASIRCGVAWADRAGHEAIVLCVCDQPHLAASHINALIARFAGEPVGSRYAGAVGVPAIFGREQFSALTALERDRGARDLLASAAAVEWPAGEIDVDREEDLPASCAILSAR
jgi:molybdenum cofactor cytidylyltransferase